ncbi:MAG: helix-turn-helix domain-containing protein [Ruminococcus sp.]|nr:helix-turn-helix domain-containing protein [Ruminococcus sp.]
MKRKLQTEFNTRQYMLSQDFEIYYYNDSHFDDVHTHTHDYYEFYFFLEGSVTMYINTKGYTLKTGDMVLIPPGTPHYTIIHNPDIPYRRFVFWISKNYFEQLIAQSDDYGFMLKHTASTKRYRYHYDTVAFNTLQAKIFQILEELHGDRFAKDAKISLCISDLILYLNRSIHEMVHPPKRREEHSLYRNLIFYIEHHLDEDLSLDHLAKEFYVSKYHVAHVFKEYFGLSVHQYIMKKRLLKCRDAILSHTSISEAYLLYGFKDYSSFFRAFKKEYGMSPKEYKELFMQEQE